MCGRNNYDGLLDESWHILKLATIMEIKDDNNIEPNWHTDFEFGEQSRKPLQLSLYYFAI